MTRFLLIRHGRAATYHSKLGIKQRQGPKANLNDSGRAQSRNLGQDLSNSGIDVMWSSPLNRAIQTADILGKYPGVPFRSKEPEDYKEIFDYGLTEIARPPIVYNAPLSLHPDLTGYEAAQYFSNLDYKAWINRTIASADWDSKYHGEGESYHELFIRETVFKYQAVDLYPDATLALVGHSNAHAFLLASMILGDNSSARDVFNFSHNHFLHYCGLAVVEYQSGHFSFIDFGIKRT